MNAHLLQPAFVDPVLDAQRGFRAALKALAEPGLIQHLPSAPRLDGLAPATYALCLALLDGDTPVWLAPSFDTPLIRANLAFHCGCPLSSGMAVSPRRFLASRRWALSMACSPPLTATYIRRAPVRCGCCVAGQSGDDLR